MKRLLKGTDNRTSIVDLDTGEVMVEDISDGMLVYLRERQKRKAPFVVAYQADLMMLSQLRLPGNCFRALMYILGTMGFQNKIECSRKELCNFLKIDQAQCSRLFLILEDNKLIILTNLGKEGKDPWWIVAPNVAWKGTVKEYTDTIHALYTVH